jgi:hypothetical protein
MGRKFSGARSMLTVARLGLCFVVGVATFYFMFWLPFSLLNR